MSQMKDCFCFCRMVSQSVKQSRRVTSIKYFLRSIQWCKLHLATRHRSQEKRLLLLHYTKSYCISLKCYQACYENCPLTESQHLSQKSWLKHERKVADDPSLSTLYSTLGAIRPSEKGSFPASPFQFSRYF